MSTNHQNDTWFTGRRPTHHPVLTLASFLDGLDVPAWMSEAVCAQTDPDAFFPQKGGSTREAKRVCLGCEVREDCLAYALDREINFGIWGGKSERERRKIRSEARRAS